MTEAPQEKIHIRKPKGHNISREEEYAGLNQLVKNVEAPFVLAVDGPWGSGKSLFIRQWIKSRDDTEGKTFLLDAWQNDYIDDPLVPLLELLTTATSADDESRSSIINKIKEIAPKVIRSSIRGGVKLATFGAIDTDEIQNIISSMVANTSADLVDDVIGSFTDQKASMQTLKDELASLVSADTGEGNVVIFIDELDRCRPDFAILMLERLKHLFDIEGLVFVVSTSTVDLANAVRGVYGPKYDGEKYLKRFFDVQYQLNTLPMADYIAGGCVELKICSKVSIAQGGNVDELVEHTAQTLSLFAHRHSVLFRDTNQFLSKLAVCVSIVEKPSVLQFRCLVTLLFCKEFLPDDYQNLIFELTPDKVTKSISKIYGDFNDNDTLGAGIRINCLSLIDIIRVSEELETGNAIVTAITTYYAQHGTASNGQGQPRNEADKLVYALNRLENHSELDDNIDQIISWVNITERISI